ncbi:MAG: inositol monophosphatase [Candidatus Poribacteria bacterium]|nr:inositol monophosphatase [Candidatus Poribacteria bacterium]
MNNQKLTLKRLAYHAGEAAKEAGEILLYFFKKEEPIDYKSPGNPVTEADRASERFLAEALKKIAPDAAFYGEEFGMQYGGGDPLQGECWVVDPLDGTANYSAGVPIFSISIALMRDGAPILGVIYDPTRDDLFKAFQGGPCLQNDSPCRVSARPPFRGISPSAVSADIIRARPPFLSSLSKGRSLGSAALQMAYIAAGGLDLAIDSRTRLWDAAAGSVLIESAGGSVTAWDGSPLFPLKSAEAFEGAPFPFLATNGVDHEAAVRRAGSELS